MKKKIIIVITTLILGIFLNCLVNEITYRRTESYHKNMIKELDGLANQKGSNKIDKKIKSYGYIEIPKIKTRRILSLKYSKSLLDKGYVCIFNNANYIQNKVGNSLLVGHNDKGVFSNLHKLKKNDIVLIFLNGKKYQYRMIKQEKVHYKKYEYRYEHSKNLLTLITCTSDKNIRLAITLEQQGL